MDAQLSPQTQPSHGRDLLGRSAQCQGGLCSSASIGFALSWSQTT